jgi:aminoglycoside phosphotransferase family enzyme
MITNEKIIEKFKNGNFAGAETSAPQHITTTISHVFVDKTKVWKVYKGDNFFFNENFNDLSKKESRFSFTRKDFIWNHRLSPEVYLELKGITLRDDKLIFGDANDSADDLVIVMNKIDMNNGLFNLLNENKLSLSDCFQIGKQLGERSKGLPQEEPVRDLYEDFVQRSNDLVSWLAGVEKYISKDEAQTYLNTFSQFVELNKIKFEKSTGLIGPCLDIHADNVVFTNGNLLPIDTYAPKEAWLYGYKFLNIYRVATDIYAFLGEEYFEQTLKGYEESTGDKLPREFDRSLVLYCELITCPYQYMLSEKDPSRLKVAEKYHIFLKRL